MRLFLAVVSGRESTLVFPQYIVCIFIFMQTIIPFTACAYGTKEEPLDVNHEVNGPLNPAHVVPKTNGFVRVHPFANIPAILGGSTFPLLHGITSLRILPRYIVF